jgi:hypothetical protein
MQMVHAEVTGSVRVGTALMDAGLRKFTAIGFRLLQIALLRELSLSRTCQLVQPIICHKSMFSLDPVFSKVITSDWFSVQTGRGGPLMVQTAFVRKNIGQVWICKHAMFPSLVNWRTEIAIHPLD